MSRREYVIGWACFVTRYQELQTQHARWMAWIEEGTVNWAEFRSWMD
jgi:hypothetical protein